MTFIDGAKCNTRVSLCQPSFYFFDKKKLNVHSDVPKSQVCGKILNSCFTTDFLKSSMNNLILCYENKYC